jgi:hypothetical protein
MGFPDALFCFQVEALISIASSCSNWASGR